MNSGRYGLDAGDIMLLLRKIKLIACIFVYRTLTIQSSLVPIVHIRVLEMIASKWLAYWNSKSTL